MVESGVGIELDGARLLKELSAILENPTITEYDFVIGEVGSLPFVLEEDKLGIEFKTAKFMSVWLNEEFSTFKRSDKNVICPDNLTKCLLLCISDNATAWNLRKDFVSKGKINPSNELNLTALILSRNPKSSEVFFHRKWLLQQLTHLPNTCDASENNCQQSDPCERCKMLEKEFEVCSKCSHRRSNNQPAWNHRFWVLNNFSCHRSKIIEKELEANAKFLSVNLSDNSAFDYRRNLVKSSMQSDAGSYDGLVAALTGELKFVRDLLDFYEGFESLWNHKKFIMHIVIEISQRKSCLSEVQKLLADLAREVAPSLKSRKSKHNHLRHSHYHHSLHRHYNHHHHNHNDLQKSEFSTVDSRRRGFEFLEKFPEGIELQASNDLMEAVQMELELFKMLRIKFQKKYLPTVESRWPDLIARRYVGWLNLRLKDFD